MLALKFLFLFGSLLDVRFLWLQPVPHLLDRVGKEGTFCHGCQIGLNVAKVDFVLIHDAVLQQCES